MPFTHNPAYITHTKCRICAKQFTEPPVFSLGDQYVSDFVDAQNVYSGHQVPITLIQCRLCGLLQQLHTAPQDFLYIRHYWYYSGFTSTMRTALNDVVHCAIDRVNLESGDVVLDIGSNDGTLLRCYPDSGLMKIGVEPAKNMQAVGKEGVDILINDFWSSDSYFKRIGIKAKIITACGMFYDLEDPNQFIRDVAKVLHSDGIFVAQLMCAKQMYDQGDVGNLAHEHLEFYTLKSLLYLFASNGLEIFDIEENPVNGGSYRIYARHIPTLVQDDFKPVNKHIEDIYNREINLLKRRTWKDFFDTIENKRKDCTNFINHAIMGGKKVWVYGASTKGNVILQYYGLNSRHIMGAIDKSPEKHGKYTVGTGIPIIHDEHIGGHNIDYMLVLPYAFIDEFVKRESDKKWRISGGKFIVPLPEFKVV